LFWGGGLPVSTLQRCEYLSLATSGHCYSVRYTPGVLLRLPLHELVPGFPPELMMQPQELPNTEEKSPGNRAPHQPTFNEASSSKNSEGTSIIKDICL
ncbi:hypothetical protein ACUWC2_28750, partial [Klebsiella pneumoniae]|uniref:hypothetical protein n=1 Tax=Klebsiella pneumoniae TaxID=573 RepID=UPI0040558296